MLKPNFIYGTAWKEDLTESCVFNALKAGFRAVDTANQRVHYYEEGAGRGLARGCEELGLKREDIFLQTKFTYARGQDERKPYDEKAPLRVQIQQSFESSLVHLQTEYIDSYVLHGPNSASGLTEVDWETWEKMEEICASGKAKQLGVSNVDFEQLAELYERAKTKPAFVQNRCFAERQWDKEIREYCVDKGIAYQGFSLLTANARFLGGNMSRPAGRKVPQFEFSDDLHEQLRAILKQTGKSISQIVFRFARQVGMIPITGTRSPDHMIADLAIDDFTLSDSQFQVVENIAFLD